MNKDVEEKIIQVTLFILSLSSILSVFLIIFQLSIDGFMAIQYWFNNGFGYSWSDDHGIIPLMYSSLYVAIGAALLAFIIGFPTAVYLAEFADFKSRNLIKSSLELLVGVPSVVMGVFGFALIGQMVWNTFNAWICVLTGWIVLALMIIPYIATISEDAMRAVPNEYREASLALGATRWQTTLHIIIPTAKSAIIASTILAMARAIGETIAVMFVVGSVVADSRLISLNPLQPSNTLTVFIAQKYQEMAGTGLTWSALWGIGVVLFILVGITNTIANTILRR